MTLYDPLNYDNLMVGLTSHFERQPKIPRQGGRRQRAGNLRFVLRGQSLCLCQNFGNREADLRGESSSSGVTERHLGGRDHPPFSKAVSTNIEIPLLRQLIYRCPISGVGILLLSLFGLRSPSDFSLIASSRSGISAWMSSATTIPDEGGITASGVGGTRCTQGGLGPRTCGQSRPLLRPRSGFAISGSASNSGTCVS